MKLVPLTAKEAVMLDALIYNDYSTDDIFAERWSDATIGSGGSGAMEHLEVPAENSFPGIISSLSRKGLVSCFKNSEGSYIVLTPLGLYAYTFSGHTRHVEISEYYRNKADQEESEDLKEARRVEEANERNSRPPLRPRNYVRATLVNTERDVDANMLQYTIHVKGGNIRNEMDYYLEALRCVCNSGLAGGVYVDSLGDDHFSVTFEEVDAREYLGRVTQLVSATVTLSW